jgi:adenosylcobinamide amidohydrolase
MVEVVHEDGDVVIKLGATYVALSNTVDGGLRTNIRYIVHHRVPKNFNDDPHKEVARAHKKHGLRSEEAITFLTATELPRNHVIRQGITHEIEFWVSITIGLSNPYRIRRGDVEYGNPNTASTINMAIIINKPLTVQAMIDALTLAAQVKAITLSELTSGSIHGTTSDAIAILALSHGEQMPYAGPATVIGRALVNTLYNALIEAYYTYINT